MAAAAADGGTPPQKVPEAAPPAESSSPAPPHWLAPLGSCPPQQHHDAAAVPATAADYAADKDNKNSAALQLLLGPHGFLRYFANTQQKLLCAYFWPSSAAGPEPRGTIVAVHGHGSHLPFEYLRSSGPGQPHLLYADSWPQKLNQAGFSFCGLDNQGCGRSEGVRCYVDCFDDYVRDVLQLIQLVRCGHLPGFHRGPPLFLLGESKGGCVALEAALRAGAALKQQQQQHSAGEASASSGATRQPRSPTSSINQQAARVHPVALPPAAAAPPPAAALGGDLPLITASGPAADAEAAAAAAAPEAISGVILLAPMLSLENVSRSGLTNRLLRHVVHAISALHPTLPVAVTAKCDMFPELEAAWNSDALCFKGKARARSASQYLKATERLMRSMPQVTVPFLAFHSERDTMCDPDGSKALYLRAASADKTLRLVNSMWHMLVKEPGNEDVLAEIVEWLQARTLPPSRHYQ